MAPDRMRGSWDRVRESSQPCCIDRNSRAKVAPEGGSQVGIGLGDTGLGLIELGDHRSGRSRGWNPQYPGGWGDAAGTTATGVAGDRPAGGQWHQQDLRGLSGAGRRVDDESWVGTLQRLEIAGIAHHRLASSDAGGRGCDPRGAGSRRDRAPRQESVSPGDGWVDVGGGRGIPVAAARSTTDRSTDRSTGRSLAATPGIKFYIGCLICGFYGGFIGAGVGALIVLLLTTSMRLSVVEAVRWKVWWVVAMSAASGLLYLSHGKFQLAVAIVLIPSYGLGAYLGGKFALKGGERLLRPIVAVLSAILALTFILQGNPVD